MVDTQKWQIGTEVVVAASQINHEDDREITLKYIGDGYLEDVRNGNKVWFNDVLFPNVFEGMCLSLGLVHNMSVCETYEVLRILNPINS
jgi:hypothetical protein